MPRCCFPALCLMAIAGCSPVAADAPKATPVTLYDPNPDHLWNRVHESLFARTDRDGKPVGRDSLDPLLFPTTKRLLEGPSHAEAVKLLDEFLTRDGDKLVRDPIKRAVFQRDLWGVFDWATYPFGNFYTAGEPIKVREGPLQQRLAKAIRKLAPSKADAEVLPDTYAAAVKAKAFPTAFDPTKPNDPFLPPDLFDSDGTWVCVTGPRAMPTPVASEHARIFAGRSAFLVFIRLPEGRKATLAYLDKLNTFPKPWKVPPGVSDEDETGRRPPPPQLNPDVPQFPVGTQVALVRQLVVVTDDGTPTATPLTESVQLRTFRTIATRSRTFPEQGLVELKLRRADLFAGKNGGLRASNGDELVPAALTFFRTWGDPFEKKLDDDSHNHPVKIFDTCAACHGADGIRSVNSYTQSGASKPTLSLGLHPVSVADARARAVEWKTGLKDWAVMKKHAGW